MNTNKKIATITGVLFIIGTVSGILSVVFIKPILNTPDYLIKMSANENQVIMGALFLIMAALQALVLEFRFFQDQENIMKVSLLELLVSGLLRECSILLA